MTQAASGRRLTRGLPPWAAPVALLVAVVAIAIAVVFLANRSGGSGAPPRPGAFVLPPPAASFDAFNVRQVDGATLTVVADAGGATSTVEIGGEVAVEALVPAAPGDIAPGDWVIVIGIFNEVRNFAITSLVVIPEAGPVAADGFARSPGGFLGVEGSRDPAERVVMGGPVVSADSGQAVLEGPDGDITIAFEQGTPPVYRLEAVATDAIRPGDRLVIPTGQALDSADAIFVRPEAVTE